VLHGASKLGRGHLGERLVTPAGNASGYEGFFLAELNSPRAVLQQEFSNRVICSTVLPVKISSWGNSVSVPSP